jgi:hypothetical protein
MEKWIPTKEKFLSSPPPHPSSTELVTGRGINIL